MLPTPIAFPIKWDLIFLWIQLSKTSSYLLSNSSLEKSEREYLNNYIVDKKQALKEGLDPLDADSYEDYYQNDYAPTRCSRRL